VFCEKEVGRGDSGNMGFFAAYGAWIKGRLGEVDGGVGREDGGEEGSEGSKRTRIEGEVEVVDLT
jgi:hypothetical protein